MYARYYGPQNLFRFLSVDPLASSAVMTLPQSWNRYAYTFNNPMRFIDPFGLENTVYMVNKAGVDDDTIAQAKTREQEVVADEGLTVEVVGEAPGELDDTDKVQTITTSDEAELPGPADDFGRGEVGGTRSEVYVDIIGSFLEQNAGEGSSGNATTMGNAIGNAGAHEVGHNLGRADVLPNGPIDLTRPAPDVMSKPMSALTLGL